LLPWLSSGADARNAFLALGAFCLAAASVAAALIREAPARESSVLADIGRPIRELRNWLLAGGSGLFVVAQIAITSYPVLFLHQHRGLSTPSAALVLAAMNVLGIGARIGTGRWSDQVQARIKPLRTLGLLIALGTAAVALLVDAPLAALVPVLIAAGGLSLSWNGIAFTAAAETAGVERSGAALGFQQTVLGVIIAAAAPAFAVLVGATSWRAAFVVAAFLAACIGVWLGKIIRGERINRMELDDISPDELVNYWCAVNGHAFCHPEIHGGHRLWRCENCGAEVESGPGWIGDVAV